MVLIHGEPQWTQRLPRSVAKELWSIPRLLVTLNPKRYIPVKKKGVVGGFRASREEEVGLVDDAPVAGDGGGYGKSGFMALVLVKSWPLRRLLAGGKCLALMMV